MKRLLAPFFALATLHAADSISLDREWRFALDPGPDSWRFPDKIQLPGILTAQGFGGQPSYETQWTGDGWRYPGLMI